MPDDNKNNAEIILAKQRNPTDAVELRFAPSSMRFDDLYRERYTCRWQICSSSQFFIATSNEQAKKAQAAAFGPTFIAFAGSPPTYTLFSLDSTSPLDGLMIKGIDSSEFRSYCHAHCQRLNLKSLGCLYI